LLDERTCTCAVALLPALGALAPLAAAIVAVTGHEAPGARLKLPVGVNRKVQPAGAALASVTVNCPVILPMLVTVWVNVAVLPGRMLCGGLEVIDGIAWLACPTVVSSVCVADLAPTEAVIVVWSIAPAEALAGGVTVKVMVVLAPPARKTLVGLT
jgi:hypothetical protein